MLSKAQIRFLKAQAHSLHPVVIIGANGLSAAVAKEIDSALKHHELIKVKLGNLPDEEQEEMIAEISQGQKAEFVSKIGHIAIFYRENPEKLGFKLPK